MLLKDSPFDLTHVKLFLSPLSDWTLPLGSVLGPFSPVLARILLGQFSEKNPPPLISDHIPHPQLFISYHSGLPSAKIL